MKTKVVALCGPTASGKTGFAVALAAQVNGAVLSVDSRQIYRGMDLGTGKDLSEYGDVPYYGIDILDPTEEYSAAKFQRHALGWLDQMVENMQTPILCGGTGHYLKALLQDYPFEAEPMDRRLAEALEAKSVEALTEQMAQLGLDGPQDSKRRMARQIEAAISGPKAEPFRADFQERFKAKVFALYRPRAELRQRIGERLDQRLNAGMIEEVQRLREQGVSDDRLRRFGLEYKWILSHLLGEIDRTELRRGLFHAICQFAKRQETFLRYLEKQGISIEPVSEVTQFVALAKDWLSQD